MIEPQLIMTEQSSRTVGLCATSTDTHHTHVLSVRQETSSPEFGGTSNEHNYNMVEHGAKPDYPKVFSRINLSANVQWGLEEAMYRNNLVTSNNKCWPKLHNALLDLAAYVNVTQGVLMYVHFTYGSEDIIVFQESGSYIGFTHNVLVKFLADQGNLSLDEVLLYRQYTPADIRQRRDYIHARSKNIRQMRKKGTSTETAKPQKVKNHTSQTYGEKLEKVRENLRSFELLIGDLRDTNDLRVKSMLVHILKYNAGIDNPEHRYIHGWNIPETALKAFKDRFSEFRDSGVNSYPFYQEQDLSDVPFCHFDLSGESLSLQMQYDILSVLPNFHWGQYVTLFGQKSSMASHNNLQQQLAYQPPRGKDSESPKFWPASPRNRFIFSVARGLPHHIKQTLVFVFSPRTENTATVYVPQETVAQANDQSVKQPTVQPKTVHVTADLPGVPGIDAGLMNTKQMHPRIKRSPPGGRDEKESNMISDIADWAVHHNITHAALAELLNILRKQHPALSVPKDPLTLLATRIKRGHFKST